MRYLILDEVVDIHHRVTQQSGGAVGIRDQSGLESSVAQPQMTFDGHDLYPTLIRKAAAVGYSLIRNHPFIDGNKRIGHATMEVFLVLNGFEIQAEVDEQEQIILSVAAGQLSREEFVAWVEAHTHTMEQEQP